LELITLKLGRRAHSRANVAIASYPTRKVPGSRKGETFPSEREGETFAAVKERDVLPPDRGEETPQGRKELL